MTGESSVANSFNTLFGSSSGPTDLATMTMVDKPLLQKQGTRLGHAELDKKAITLRNSQLCSRRSH
jgi:hypothetical protein